jgi:hypothetical protein
MWLTASFLLDNHSIRISSSESTRALDKEHSIYSSVLCRIPDNPDYERVAGGTRPRTASTQVGRPGGQLGGCIGQR